MILCEIYVIIMYSNIIFFKSNNERSCYNMSVVFENDNKEVCVILCENDYIKVMTSNNDKGYLVITRKNDKLNVEYKETKNERSK